MSDDYSQVSASISCLSHVNNDDIDPLGGVGSPFPSERFDGTGLEVRDLPGGCSDVVDQPYYHQPGRSVQVSTFLRCVFYHLDAIVCCATVCSVEQAFRFQWAASDWLLRRDPLTGHQQPATKVCSGNHPSLLPDTACPMVNSKYNRSDRQYAQR